MLDSKKSSKKLKIQGSSDKESIRAKRAAETKKRQERRARWKKQQKELKKELKKDSSELVLEFQEIMATPHFSLGSEFETAIRPIKLDEPMFVENKPVAPIQVYRSAESKVENLTLNIDIIDDRIKAVCGKISKLKLAKSQLEIKLEDSKYRIRRDEDLIYKHEINLDRVESLEANDWDLENHPDTPDFVRRIKELVFQQPDELLTQLRLSRLDVRLSERQRLKVNYESQLSNISLALEYQEDLLAGLDNASQNYRKLRNELGKTKRDLRQSIQKQNVETVQQALVSGFLDNLQKINRVGEDFQAIMQQHIEQLSMAYSDQEVPNENE